MDEKLKLSIVFALRMYALTTRTEDLEKLGYSVKCRAGTTITKRFFKDGVEVGGVKYTDSKHYKVWTTESATDEFFYAFAQFFRPL
jgi:hypothetical protein